MGHRCDGQIRVTRDHGIINELNGKFLTQRALGHVGTNGCLKRHAKAHLRLDSGEGASVPRGFADYQITGRNRVAVSDNDVSGPGVRLNPRG